VFDNLRTLACNLSWYDRSSPELTISKFSPPEFVNCSSLRWIPFLILAISVFPVEPLDVISSKLFRSSSAMLSIIVPLLKWLLELDVVDATDLFLPLLRSLRTVSVPPSHDDVVEFPLSLILCSLVLQMWLFRIIFTCV